MFSLSSYEWLFNTESGLCLGVGRTVSAPGIYPVLDKTGSPVIGMGDGNALHKQDRLLVIDINSTYRGRFLFLC